MRLCVIGDELVAGTGDSRSLGWIGRVCARSRFKVPATVMALAMPGETTKEMGMRWEAEVSPRLADDQPRGLVIGVGPADVPAGVSTARSRLNLANITDRAAVLGNVPRPLSGCGSAHHDESADSQPQADQYARHDDHHCPGPRTPVSHVLEDRVECQQHDHHVESRQRELCDDGGQQYRVSPPREERDPGDEESDHGEGSR